MAHLIRHKLMAQGTEPFDSGNPVEMDETSVGGRRRGTRRGRPGPESNKVPVFGMGQREGKVAAMIVPNVRRATVFPHAAQYVLPKSTVYTDELDVYDGLKAEGYRHRRVPTSRART